MKKLYTIFIILSSAIFLTGCYNSEDRGKILKIYNWGDYIDEEVLAAFPEWYKEQTGEDVRIVYQTFDINEIMLTKIERGKEDFDVVCPSEYIIERMIVKDLLLPIDTAFGKTPNYIHNVSRVHVGYGRNTLQQEICINRRSIYMAFFMGQQVSQQAADERQL